jgi:APA family basic amino acid/polyamine antiporter
VSHFGSKSVGGLSDVYNGIILLATFTTLVPYAFCSMAELLIALPVRRRGANTANDGQRLWLTAAIGIAAFVFSALCIVGAGADTALKGFLALLLGLPVYVWLQRKNAATSIGAQT